MGQAGEARPDPAARQPRATPYHTPSTPFHHTHFGLSFPRARVQIHSALKKVEVEDLGGMDAPRLWAAMPEEDGAGRGRRDLAALEHELGVKVCFCEDGHVLLVGARARLQKKCFVLRNLLSHYHWRQSGKDVAFEAMVAR